MTTNQPKQDDDDHDDILVVPALPVIRTFVLKYKDNTEITIEAHRFLVDKTGCISFEIFNWHPGLKVVFTQVPFCVAGHMWREVREAMIAGVSARTAH